MKDEVRFGLRLLARSPGWTAVAVLSLALGIGANAVGFSLVDAVLLKPFPYDDPERLVLLWGAKNEQTTRGISGPDLHDWRQQSHTFQDMDAFLENMKFSLGTDASDTVPGACMGARVLPMLGVRPALGRNFVAADERLDAPRVVMLSEALWRTRFAGDPGVVGRTIRLGDQPYEVAGVTPAGFFFPDTDARLWVAAPCGLAGFDKREWPLLHAVGRLKSGVSVEQAQADLDDVNRRLAQAYPDTNRDTTTGIFPLRHIVIGKFERALWMLLAAVGVVLLIACANVAHLQLARGVERETELAIRAAAGASRSRLLRQLLTENLLLAGLAGTLGLVVAWGGVRALRSFALTDIPRMDGASLDLRVVGFTLVVSLLTGVVSGLWPAWKASRVRVSDTLKSGGLTTTSAARSQLRDLLAISEIAAAITLLVTTGLIVRSFVQLSRAEWGFNPDKLLLIDVKAPPEVKKQRDLANEWAETVVARLKTIDGVERASRSDNAPIRWSGWKPTWLGIDGRMVTKDWSAGAWVVGHGYFATAGIPILDGREFTVDDTETAPRRVVISRTLARKVWPTQRAVGKHFELLELKNINGRPLPEIEARMKRRDRTLEGDPTIVQPVEGLSWKVIGVVADVRMFSLDIASNPALYLDHRQNPRSRMWGMDMSGFGAKFLLRTKNKPTEVIERAKAAILSVNQRAAFTEVVSMQDVVSAKIGGRGTNKLMVLVSTLFGGLALTFAVIGIYGVVSYNVTHRLREIGIRMALGAGQRDVVRVVMGYATRLLISGLALGLTAAWGLTRGLQSQLFGIKFTDAPTYAAAVAILASAALAACLLPLRRALRFDPVALFKA